MYFGCKAQTNSNCESLIFIGWVAYEGNNMLEMSMLNIFHSFPDPAKREKLNLFQSLFSIAIAFDLTRTWFNNIVTQWRNYTDRPKFSLKIRKLLKKSFFIDSITRSFNFLDFSKKILLNLNNKKSILLLPIYQAAITKIQYSPKDSTCLLFFYIAKSWQYNFQLLWTEYPPQNNRDLVHIR